MKLNRNTTTVFILLLICFDAFSCNRQPRDVDHDGRPIVIYVSPGDSVVNVAFPERDLLGAIPEQTNGLSLIPDEEKHNRFGIQVKETYRGLLIVDGASGESYMLDVKTREDCPDSLVTIKKPSKNLLTESKRSPIDDTRATLMQYLWHAFDPREQPPPGYRRMSYTDLSREKRLVFEESGVRLYYDTVYEGPKYTGFIFEIVNTSRSAKYFDFRSIDFNDPRIIEILGIAREITMVPTNQTLDPAPEYVEDVYSNVSSGFLYIVSEVVNGHARR